MDQPVDRKDLHFRSTTFQGMAPGPKLVVTGAVHGNETCGPQAIQRLIREIESGELKVRAGTATFVPVTNPLAYAKRSRAGDRNLNRNLAPTDSPKDFEDHVANWLCPLLARHEALLDLHSTSAATQPFVSLGPRDNAGSVEPYKLSGKERDMAKRVGVSRFIEGWLSAYATGVARRQQKGTGSVLNRDARYGVGTTEYMRSVGGYAFTLECGQHDDPRSVEVAYRAIRNTLAFLGIADGDVPQPVERYEALRLRDVIDRDHPEDRFTRTWSSFDPLKKGDVIGVRQTGEELVADRDGWIIFPDAKAQPGHEWFYLAEPVDAI